MSDRQSMSEIPECGGDAAAYALGALEPHEVENFRQHMLGCAVCRDEVEALAGVVQSLPLAARQYVAPRDLNRRVMREVRRDHARAARVSSRRGFSWQGARERLAAAAATIIAAGGVVAGLELTAGAAVTVIQAQVSGVAGSAQLRVAGGHGELVVRHLTPPSQGHTYEVWLKSGSSSPVPASVLFGVNSSGSADVGIPKRLHGVSAVMVTQEPLNGTAKPTEPPVIVARIA